MFPLLQTERFSLEPFQPEDQGFIFDGLSHPEVIRYYGVSYHSFDSARTQLEWYHRLQREETGIWWKIVSLATGERIGAIGMNNFSRQHQRTEIGYWLLPLFWKQGVIGEVLPVVLDYFFRKRGIHRIEAVVEEENKASCRVLEKAGFTCEGRLRDYEIKNGRFITLFVYSLLSGDKRNGPGAGGSGQ